MRPQLIAIDGPVAVGKSTIGSLLAQRLGYTFVDTGVIYRALTRKALRLGIDLEDENKLSQLAANTKIECAGKQSLNVFVDGEDVSDMAHFPEVEKNVSLVSRVLEVRRAVVKEQRRLAQRGGMVMVGRDIGTVVLPGADLKIFLTASLEARAQRRYLELLSKGEKADYEAISGEIMKRDEMDSQRAVSPLKPAADAKIIDTGDLAPEQVVQKILDLMEG